MHYVTIPVQVPVGRYLCVLCHQRRVRSQLVHIDGEVGLDAAGRVTMKYRCSTCGACMDLAPSKTTTCPGCGGEHPVFFEGRKGNAPITKNTRVVAQPGSGSAGDRLGDALGVQGIRHRGY